MLSLAPRRSDRALQSVCARPCCLHPRKEGSASGVLVFRGHLWVHFRYGPVTCSPSQGWLCQLASSASFPPHGCNPSYGVLTFTPVGLSPTEHASLHWTHLPPANQSYHRQAPESSGFSPALVAEGGSADGRLLVVMKFLSSYVRQLSFSLAWIHRQPDLVTAGNEVDRPCCRCSPLFRLIDGSAEIVSGAADGRSESAP